jgi:cation transport protein ChaC
MTHANTKSRLLPRGITREVLERDGLSKAFAAAYPDVAVSSDETRRESIRGLLATRPAGQQEAGVWLFAYGSLLWNPCVEVAAWRGALLYGFHRDFRIQLTEGRGSPDAPGLMLGLVSGGSCHGMGMRLPPEDLEHEMLLVWRREMLTGVYKPRWVTLYGDGERWPAITFVIDPHNPRFRNRLDDETMVRMLATGRGVLGSSFEYLLNTVAQLDRQDIPDRRLRMLRGRVKAMLAAGNAG